MGIGVSRRCGYGARSDLIARKLVDAARAKKIVERSGGIDYDTDSSRCNRQAGYEAWRRNEKRLRQCRLGTDARRRRGGSGGGREGGKDEGVRLLVVQVVQAQAVGCGAGASKTSGQGSRLSDGQRQERGLDANPAPFARAPGGRCEHDGHCRLSANACNYECLYEYAACA